MVEERLKKGLKELTFYKKLRPRDIPELILERINVANL